ncbi:hypothetical protein AQUCO_06600047v1 [Aquilegia coerulea]|uniref:C2H2-type domain-containing protein n=1 Tax=Aquilegia coerulea TaxID=218851 RepID=A0A2G5CC63_AQUCA|nr:hypothetical protein AQUCO_06600047v1 [Aquilegia coerulea]
MHHHQHHPLLNMTKTLFAIAVALALVTLAIATTTTKASERDEPNNFTGHHFAVPTEHFSCSLDEKLPCRSKNQYKLDNDTLVEHVGEARSVELPQGKVDYAFKNNKVRCLDDYIKTVRNDAHGFTYGCKICSKSFRKHEGVLFHIYREHPDILKNISKVGCKGNAKESIKA